MEDLERRREEETRPLREAGEGEAEGFEESEAELIEHASHGDPGPDPSHLAGEPEDLEAIAKAIDQHNATCPWPASEVRLNPFEVERLGWEEIRGLPVVPDPALGTGRFRIVCSREGEREGLEETEAVGTPIEVGVGADEPPVRPPV